MHCTKHIESSGKFFVILDHLHGQLLQTHSKNRLWLKNDTDTWEYKQTEITSFKILSTEFEFVKHVFYGPSKQVSKQVSYSTGVLLSCPPVSTSQSWDGRAGAHHMPRCPLHTALCTHRAWVPEEDDRRGASLGSLLRSPVQSAWISAWLIYTVHVVPHGITSTQWAWFLTA